MSKNTQNTNAANQSGNETCGENQGEGGMVDKAMQTAQRAGGAGGDAAQRASQAVTDSYGQVSERTRDVANRTREMAGQWEQGVETAVQANPLSSVVIAAGVGLAIGFILGYELRPSQTRYEQLKSLLKA